MPFPIASFLETATRISGSQTVSFAISRETTSTNTDALTGLEAISEGACKHWMACTQTQGRGRQGRRWESQLGQSLYYTFGGRTDSPLPPAMTLIAGVLVADAISEVARPHQRVQLKWPNDIITTGDDGPRKLGGILCERSGDRFVIGIGINIGTPPSVTAGITPGALPTSVSTAELAGAIAGRLERLWQSPDQWSFEHWQARYDALLAWKGQPIVITERDASWHGTMVGVSDTGAVLGVADDGTQATFDIGDVTLRPKPRD